MFAIADKKLDLDENDRTVESWGFLKNKGSEYEIYTYRALSREELDAFMVLINKYHAKDKNGKINSKLDNN